MPAETRNIPEVELLTDREAAAFLRVGVTKWFEIQKQPDFPAPLWFGPRLKRHVKAKLIGWAESRHERPPEPSALAGTCKADAERRGAA